MLIARSGSVRGRFDRSFAGRAVAVLVVALMMVTALPLPVAQAADDQIAVLYPNGGERIVAGSTVTVLWSVNRAGGYITVSLSRDGAVSWDDIETIANAPSAGQGSYDLFVPPNLNSTACKVIVTWRSEPVKPWVVYGADRSDANFSVAPGLAIGLRDVPTTVSYARYYLTTWDLFDPGGLVGGLRFTWRVDEGSGYGAWEALPNTPSSVDPAQGWVWWMPSYYESATAQMRVEAVSVAGSTVLGVDISDPFSVSSPTVTLIQPDGGVVLVGGTTYTIKWRTSSDPAQVIVGVKLEYSTDGGTSWITITPSTVNDFDEPWDVPKGVDSGKVLVRVSAQAGEWIPFAHDESSSANRIISDPDTLTVSLVAPNPPVDGGEVLLSEDTYSIKWTVTGPTSDIKQFDLYYSTDSGSTWHPITSAPAAARSHPWGVPDVDSYTARVKVELVPITGSPTSARSNHDFYIFFTIAYNRPPVALAGRDQTAVEGDVVTLDGSASYDMDRDVLTYSWTKVSPASIDVTIVNATHARPTFTKSLAYDPVTFVFELSVSDGLAHTDPLLYNTSRTSVTVVPRPPAITNVWPDTGWSGTPLLIEGSDLMGALVLMDGVVIGSVPSDPRPPLNPDPDSQFTLILTPAVPHGKHHVTVRNTAGEVTFAGEFEVFPEPVWQFENGLGFHNPTRDSLSYPWNPLDEGRYKDAFGNQVYICIWVCIGVPYWTPWDGWDCAGYLIDQPFLPDPLAAIYYAAVFWWMGQNGECFGMSTTALRFYHDQISVSSFVPSGSTFPRELDAARRLREHIDYQQGGQMSSEIINSYLGGLISGLIPSSDVTGLGSWVNDVKESIDTGDLGIATMICDEGAHAVVPYAYEDVDPTHIRFYVYDSNRENFSYPDRAIEQAKWWGDSNDNPPYIEVDKSGLYWDWSFLAADGAMWSSPVGISFVPWSVVGGPRTMPLSIDGIIHLIVGDAGIAVEDGGGGRVGYDASGHLEWGIEGAAPLPMFSGPGWRAQSWYLPGGNYTDTVTGTKAGAYNWSAINDGRNAFSIERAETSAGSVDTMSVDYPDGNPYNGRMEYGTTDAKKVYTLAQVNRFGVQERVYRIINATLTSSGTHGIGTSDKYSGIRFTNNGDAPVTFDVEFQGNMVSEAVWNSTSRPASGLPMAHREGITVLPGQTVVIRPTSWGDLDHALVIVEGETVPGTPEKLVATSTGPQVTVGWAAPASDGGWPITRYVVFRKEASGDPVQLAEVAKGTTYVDSTVERGRTYYYTVLASNALGDGPQSPEASVTVASQTPPSAPTDLAVAQAVGRVTVTWGAPKDDGGSPVTGFKVMRGEIAGALAVVGTVGASATSYMDVGVRPGMTYRYTVLATNAIGDGPQALEASITMPSATLPSAPTGIIVTQSGGKVTVTWGAPASDGGSPITGYKVLRGELAGALTVIGTVGPSATSYVDGDAKAGRTYHYTVVAMNAVGDGTAPAETLVATPKDGGGGGGFPWALVLLVVMVLVVAVVAGAALVKRKGGGMAPMLASAHPTEHAGTAPATGPPPDAPPAGPPPGGGGA